MIRNAAKKVIAFGLVICIAMGSTAIAHADTECDYIDILPILIVIEEDYEG